jgi:hypothetical protein
MHITDLKWWQWAIVGLFLGALAGSVRSFYADIPDSGVRQTLSQKEFERDLFRKNEDRAYPFFEDLKVVPWEDRQIIIGRFMDVRRHRDPKNHKAKPTITTQERIFRVVPDVPYKPTARFKGDFPKDLTPVKFLAWVQQKHPELKVQYRYDWWTAPKAQFAMWIGGSVVLFGLVWPTTINLLLFGRPWRPKQPKEDYDLDRFEKTEPTPPPAPTEADHDALHSQIAAIEAELETGAASGVSPSGISVEAPAAIRKLDAGPLEGGATAEQTQEEKDYAGEFYPTATHVPKRNE